MFPYKKQRVVRFTCNSMFIKKSIVFIEYALCFKLPAKTADNRYLRRFLPAYAGKFTCGTGYLQPSQVILHAPVLQCNLYLKKTTVIFFSDFDWHDLGFFGKILIFLGFLGKINCQDLGKKSKKSKILARKPRRQAPGRSNEGVSSKEFIHPFVLHSFQTFRQ